MTQLAAVVKEKKCRKCKKKNLKSFLEIEGVVVVVQRDKPHPFGGSVYIHRGIFCNIVCFQEYLWSEYKKIKKGRVGGW